MKYYGFAFGLISALFNASAAQSATRIADPVQFIRGIYAGFVKDPNDFTEPDDVYSPRIAQLFAADQADGAKAQGVGRLDWDAWVNAQAVDIKDVTVTSRPDEFRNDREIVQVTMLNGGKPAKVYFYFELVKERWQIDDIRWPGENGWTLSVVLKYGSDFVPQPDRKYPY